MSLPRSNLKATTEPAARVDHWRQRFESVFEQLLPPPSTRPSLLHRAMRYATLDGGKRVRPALVYASGEALGLDQQQLDPLAAAIEIIHAYSLIHDDLPAMDDDDLRRGRPTTHRAFDEATAILAGDALQALAFEVLGSHGSALPEVRLKLVTALARACGSMGMAGGQVLDLDAVGKTLQLEQLETMHRLKTGALIELCLAGPAIVAGAPGPVEHSLREYGACVGLAFQVHDDILDVVGKKETMGKQSLADQKLDKPTFPSIIGLEASIQRAGALRDQAVAALDCCPGDPSALIYLADYVVSRDR